MSMLFDVDLKIPETTSLSLAEEDMGSSKYFEVCNR